jgi:hypothetical protein
LLIIRTITGSEVPSISTTPWAKAHDTVRSDAIRQLVELGLNSTPSANSLGAARRDPVEIEDSAVKQIDQLLDPSLPIAERERRIRRLTEGPPESSDECLDPAAEKMSGPWPTTTRSMTTCFSGLQGATGSRR